MLSTATEMEFNERYVKSVSSNSGTQPVTEFSTLWSRILMAEAVLISVPQAALASAAGKSIVAG